MCYISLFYFKFTALYYVICLELGTLDFVLVIAVKVPSLFWLFFSPMLQKNRWQHVMILFKAEWSGEG